MSPPQRHALFLSQVLPSYFRDRASGLQRRFALLVDGVSRTVDAIDFLVFVDAWRASDIESHRHQSLEVLEQMVDVPVTLRLVPLAVQAPHRNLLRDYVLGSSSFSRLPAFRPYTGPPQVAAVQSALAKEPTFLFIQRLACAAPWLRLAHGASSAPAFFDLDDIEHIAYRRAIEQPPLWRSKRLAYLHLPALISGEARAVTRARAAFVCSEEDRSTLQRWCPRARIICLPNAVDLPPAHSLAQEPRLLYLGAYTFAPNRVAAEFLIDHIWPRVLAALPSAKLVIAGAHPEAIRQYGHAPPGVQFPGFVPDLAQLYREARIVVAPLQTGAGTRVKILEAAAHGCPIVSTRIGAEGLKFRDGIEIVIRDRAAAFADACIELLRDSARCLALGTAARALVASSYRRGDIAATLADTLNENLT